MKKSYALFIALSISIVLAGNWIIFHDFSSEREKVIIQETIDGDTVTLEDGRKVRLLNINTPEKDDFWYKEASDFLKTYENTSVEMETEGLDKYGRTLGRIFADKYVNLEIVRLGLAHPYIVDEEEIKIFRAAEAEAKSKDLGIWQKSEYYGCLQAEINKKEEYVVIEDDCGLDFEDFTLKDESTNRYKFGEFKAEKFIFYSEKGTNNETALFWGRGSAWNDDKDAIFIRDAEGLLVYYYSYGY